MKQRMLIAAVTGLLLGTAASTASATTFTAAVDPPKPGTASAPQAHKVTFDTSAIKANSAGHPSTGTITLDQVFPVGFAPALDKFGVCSASTVIKAFKTQPSCPASSVLGTVEAKLFAPIVNGDATTDKAFVYKTGPDTFIAWLHVSKPVEVGATLSGVLKPATADSGPTASWDFGPAARRENGPGIELRPSRWKVDWTVASAKAAPKPKAKKKVKKPTCLQKARKVKDHKARARKVKACQRAAAKRKKSKAKPKTKTRQAQLRADSTSTFSPFMSTGCASGTWNMQVHFLYVDKSEESLSSAITCGTGATTSGTTGTPVDSLLGIIPIPSVKQHG